MATSIRKKTKPAKETSQESGTSTGLKYADKSAGQPELIPIFETLKKLLLPYVKGPIKLRGGEGGQMALVSEKEIEIAGRKRKELWFAAILIQKGYVGFYYMPVYVETDIKKIFQPELLKLLKGKSCFHIKKLDEDLIAQIKSALKLGYAMYKKVGWV